MVVSLNHGWKIPIAFFFVNSLSGKEKANLVQIALDKLRDTGAYVTSITCDGPASHLAMASSLGMTLDPLHLKTNIPFDLNDPTLRTHFFLDAACVRG